MPTITATVDANRAGVRLDIDFSDVGAPYLSVTRTVVATGAVSAVRTYGTTTAGQVNTSAGKTVLWDFECPLDTLVTYTATCNTLGALVTLNANPFFENAQLTPWTAIGNATLAVVTTTPQQGLSSLRVTPDGVTAVPGALAEEVKVTVAQNYTLTGFLNSTTARTLRVGISWYDASHAFLSNSLISQAVLVNTSTKFGPTVFAAPASAAFGRIVTSDAGTPAAGATWLADSMTIATAINSSVATGAVTVPSNGFGWLKDPLRPGNSVRIDCSKAVNRYAVRATPVGAGVALIGLEAKTRKANESAFVVNNSPFPPAITRARNSQNGKLALLARSFVDRDAVNALCAPGSALLLQLPSKYGEPDKYLLVQDTSEGRVFNDHSVQPRAFSLPFTEVAAPGGPMQGALGARFQDLCNRYPTWTALTGAGLTWQQVLDGLAG